MEGLQRVNHTTRVLSSRNELYMTGDFSDVTLVSDDYTQFKCHKTVLASASEVLKTLLKLNNEQHPLIFLKGVKQNEMKALLEYLYLGSVAIESENVVNLKEAMNHLQIENKLNMESKLMHLKHSNKLDFLSSTDDMEQRKPRKPSNPTKEGLSFLNDYDEIGMETGDVKSEAKKEENDVAIDTNSSLKILKELLEENDLHDGTTTGENIYDEGDTEDYALEEDTSDMKDSENDALPEISSEEQVDDIQKESKSVKYKRKKSTQNRKPEEGPSECEVCAATFTTRRSMQRHNKIVHELHTVECNICGVTLKGKDVLRGHKLRVHDKKRYPCPKCDMDFGCAYSRTKHIRDVHTAKCDYCKLTFETLDQFNEHIQIEHVNKFC